MNGWAVFLILVFVAVVVLGVGFIVYVPEFDANQVNADSHRQRQLRARRLGLPAPPLNPFARSGRGGSSGYTPPAPAPGGIGGWFKDKFAALRNNDLSGGSYEATTFESGGRRRAGFSPLDPDEAWDTRVGNEADYSVPSGQGPYGSEEASIGLRDPGAGPYGGSGYTERGRHSQHELDDRYDAAMGRTSTEHDPFGEGAERSNLRDVSPRPLDHHDRRSAFREDM